MENKIWLTTVDNPFNPFKQFDSWFNFDVIKGYNTCSKIDRFMQNYKISVPRDGDSDTIEQAINKIIEYDFTNVYRKVDERSFDKKSTATNQ